MSVALIGIADWIEQLSVNGVDCTTDGIGRLEAIQSALGINLELECHSYGQLEEIFDSFLDETMPDTEILDNTISSSEILKNCREDAYIQLLLEYIDQHYVEHANWYYDVDDIVYRSSDIVEDVRTAFEDAVLAEFDKKSGEYEQLDGMTGQSEFFQTYKSVWQKLELAKSMRGLGVNRPHSRLM